MGKTKKTTSLIFGYLDKVIRTDGRTDMIICRNAIAFKKINVANSFVMSIMYCNEIEKTVPKLHLNDFIKRFLSTSFSYFVGMSFFIACHLDTWRI